MSITFNSAELLEMAERMEHDGGDFYRKAAELFTNPYAHDLLVNLAKMEADHETTFAEMRAEIPKEEQQSGDFDSDDDLSLYLQVMQGFDVFRKRSDVSEDLTGTEDIKDILKKAIEKEKDSIVYYLALKKFVRTENAKKKIDDIIQEEMRHIGVLERSLKGLA